MEFTVTLTGTTPILMHNSRLANPLDPTTKALKKVTGKTKKTEDDHLQIAHLEWLGSLYHDPDIGPYIPGDNIWRLLYDAAKKHKLGPRVKESVIITSDVNPLAYQGPRGLDPLWKDENYRFTASVKNGTNRVMRTRPIFRNWKVDATGIVDTSELDVDALVMIVETAGQLVGLGDWRPRYGRFAGAVAAA